jgi:phenylacetate-coenzyme A ligase PaaK-like adenylate-forming protein
MPLLRYRTGDLARWLPGPCPCGSPLARLDRVRGRLEAEVPLGSGLRLGIADLDEAIFPLEGVVDYQAEVCHGPDGDRLGITLHVPGAPTDKTPAAAEAALGRAPALAAALAAGALALDPVRLAPAAPSPATVKRRIRDIRERKRTHASSG